MRSGACSVRALHHCKSALSLLEHEPAPDQLQHPTGRRRVPGLRAFSRRLAPLSSGDPVNPAYIERRLCDLPGFDRVVLKHAAAFNKVWLVQRSSIHLFGFNFDSLERLLGSGGSELVQPRATSGGKGVLTREAPRAQGLSAAALLKTMYAKTSYADIQQSRDEFRSC